MIPVSYPECEIDITDEDGLVPNAPVECQHCEETFACVSTIMEHNMFGEAIN
jgi:hypothetical protein